MSLVQHNGALEAHRPTFSSEEMDTLKRTIAYGTSDAELALFAQVCTRTGLDPFAKQIYPVMRFNKKAGREIMVIQTGIDGYRLIAERTRHYRGQVGPFWCGQDGNWRDVWLESDPPAAAKVGVLRDDFSEPLWAVARFDSYKQTYKDGKLSGLWATMPEVMIAKCSEALALRRAFPNDLSGIYTSEEMAQADHAEAIDVNLSPDDPNDPPISDEAANLIAMQLNDIADQDERRLAKHRFMERFGLPTALRSSQLKLAYEFLLNEIVAGPAPVVAGDTDGGNDGTGGAIPAESEEASLSEVSTPDPPDYDALVPSFVDPPKLESAHPATLFHEAVKAAMSMIPDGATDSDLRHAAVSAATDGATEDWRQAHGDGLDAATEAITQVAEGTLVMHRTALGWELRQPRPGETPAPTKLGELRAVIAKIPGLGEQRTLKRARRVAEDNGWPLPDSFEAISGPVLDAVYAEALAKLDEVGA